MPKQYDHAVLIGRFEPFHNGHAALLDHALTLANHVVVVIGSAGAARNCKNPFTANERARMVRDYLQDMAREQGMPRFDYEARVQVVEVRDYHYNDALWVTELQQKVYRCTQRRGSTALVGFQKDDSSYYLSLFPSWEFEQAPATMLGDRTLDATTVRGLLFESGLSPEVGRLLPRATVSVIDSVMRGGEGWGDLVDQHRYLRTYAYQWGKGPFLTADALCTKDGHVLVIRRGQIPGKGLLALPGGFLEGTETLKQTAIRELTEETGIGLTKIELDRLIVADQVFDHPSRSERGRLVTRAFHFDLDRGGLLGLPWVTGQDDAADAFWLPISDAVQSPHLFFEDHHSIISHFVMRY